MRYLLGIDVSSHQPPGAVDWCALRAQGVAFAFVRATIGLGEDEVWREHLDRARCAGVERLGVYHVFKPRRDARAQLDHFVATIEGANSLIPAIDVELLDDRTPAEVAAGVLDFVRGIEQHLQRKCVIYTYPYFATSIPWSSELARHPLWIAHYGVSRPIVPNPWTDWTIWQHDGNGGARLPSGVDVDFNRFRGTAEDFARLVG